MFLSTWRQWFHRRTGTIVTMFFFVFFFLKLWLWKDTLTHILIKHLAKHKNTIEHNLNTGCLEIHVQHQHVSLLALCPSSYLLFRFVEKLLIYCKHGSFMRFTYSILHQTLKCGQLATFYIIFKNVFFSCWNQWRQPWKKISLVKLNVHIWP